MSKKLTIGMILSGIAAVGFLIWVFSAVAPALVDPTNPQNIAHVAEQGAQKIADDAIPTPVTIILGIVALFGGGIFAAFLILGVVVGWDKIENFNVLPFIEDAFDYFSSNEGSL